MKKTKKQSKAPAVKKTARARQYEAHYMALILIGFLIVEGLFITQTHTADWQYGAAVLDISTQVASDAANVINPVSDVVSGINQFYQIAATEATPLFDISQSDPIGDLSFIAGGVSEFYSQAATQMAQLLDLSDSGNSWSGNVAGASTIR